jgi:hypothetical protein
MAARQHESEHDYALSEMKLSRQEILAEFHEVFETFGFDHKGDDEKRAKGESTE